MTTFYTLNNRVYYVPVEAIPHLTDAMCEEKVTRDGKSIYVLRKGLSNYLREIFDDLGRYTFQQLIPVIHNRSHPLLNLGETALRKIVAYVGPYQGFLHQTCQAFFKRVEPINNCLAMAGEGDLAMLKEMRPKEMRMEEICQAVLESRSESEDARLSVLKWLVTEKKYDINVMPFRLSVENGDLKILEWARTGTEGFFKKSPWVKRSFAIAAQYGKIEVLEWARLKGANIKKFDYEGATKNGHLSALEWAYNNNVELSRSIFFRAALYGHLHILKWGVQENLFKLKHTHFSLTEYPEMFPFDFESIVWTADTDLEILRFKSYLTEFGFCKEKLT